ncbi:hypothetical protein [Burkholderia ubonensis]|uniref:hypothetical protein n=1 Tax=Burkholderia ubonensis TaxID=101571 RepID=UPI000A65735D|nr:hypothetical protein [Burkholderia ubonensis]
MLRTIYAAAPYETAFSLLEALATTTCDHVIQVAAEHAYYLRSPLLQTAPCRLTRFCALTEGAYGEPEQVLARRTTYPFYMSSLPAPLAAMLAAQVCGTGRTHVMCPAVPTPLQVENRYGLACPECGLQSRTETGRYCSLTFHCLPFLSRCPLHGCLLYLADRCSAHEFAARTAGNHARQRNSLHLSRVCMRLLASRDCHCALDEVKSLLLERRYLTDDGVLMATELTHDINAVLSDGFEDERLNVWLFQIELVRQVVRHMQQLKRAHHPTEIAVLLTALEQIECSHLPRASTFDEPAAQALENPSPVNLLDSRFH